MAHSMKEMAGIREKENECIKYSITDKTRNKQRSKNM
jgi:hypothetical protein